jgi:hypothetical protein
MRTVEDAKAGDARAREWLTRHLLGKGDGSRPLTALAIKEAAGIDPAQEVARQAEDLGRRSWLDDALDNLGRS